MKQTVRPAWAAGMAEGAGKEYVGVGVGVCVSDPEEAQETMNSRGIRIGRTLRATDFIR